MNDSFFGEMCSELAEYYARQFRKGETYTYDEILNGPLFFLQERYGTASETTNALACLRTVFNWVLIEDYCKINGKYEIIEEVDPEKLERRVLEEHGWKTYMQESREELETCLSN